MMTPSIVLPLVWLGSVVSAAPCADLSTTKGRCGPDFGRCNLNLASYARYCNTANGWCGDTYGHMNAQAGDEWDFEPASCECVGHAYRLAEGQVCCDGLSEVVLKTSSTWDQGTTYCSDGTLSSARAPRPPAEPYSSARGPMPPAEPYSSARQLGGPYSSARQLGGPYSSARARGPMPPAEPYSAKFAAEHVAPWAGQASQVAENSIPAGVYWLGGFIAAMLAIIAGLLCFVICIQPLMRSIQTTPEKYAAVRTWRAGSRW